MKLLLKSLALLLVAQSTGLASSVYRDNLGASLRYSSEAAVVRISSKKEITFTFQDKNRVCGYRYRAEVLESLKGQAASISFFFVSDDIEVGKRYFMLGFPVDTSAAREGASSVIEEMEEVDRAEYECRMTASEIYVRDDPKTLFALSERATELLGGEWIVVEGNSLLLGEGLEERTITDGDAHIRVFSWTSVEALVRRLVENGS